MIQSARTIFWHRRDLRTADNLGLKAAATTGSVLPLFVLDSDLLSLAGPERTGFLLASLASLQQTYRQLGSDLVVREGDPTQVIPSLCSEFDIEAVVWNQDHSKYARERDLAVRDSLPTEVDATAHADMTLHEPGSIRTTKGDNYSVFSYYYKKWTDRERTPSAEEPSETAFVDLSAKSVADIVTSPTDSLPLPAGRTAATDRLEAFVDGPIFEYAETRDDPAAAGSSRLSQDLSFGLLGIREVYEATERANERADSKQARESIEAYQRQLAWRDFYVQVLAANPETVTENFKSFENPIEWRENPEHLDAWKAGRTGYPIVDAGMRQLMSESYMHNRVRMIVASFLTKDLQLDWRKGYHWFRTQLLDHETANDVGGWQWAASTGTDAQPYFRIFNPMTQGERHDPEATYIKTYVPELEAVESSVIHSWDELDPESRQAEAPDYPDPIVDHGTRRESAIAMFERARGKTD